ncbi:MAG: SpoIIE family protein phosphatase [Methylococcaceae bacterium]|nr:SpoIIE family protein phosphatase [Methylococcaceae bacterium]
MKATRNGIPTSQEIHVNAMNPDDAETITESTVFAQKTYNPLTKSQTDAEESLHCLVLIEGFQPGLVIPLQATPLVLGRALPSDILIADSMVSRKHCRVELVHDELIVTDLNSSNGTFIDGKRVMMGMVLPRGGILQIGNQVWMHERRNKREMENWQDINRDLEKASQYVQSQLPPPIQEGPIRTNWFFLPSRKLGGDAFGYHRLDEHHFVIYLLDVSGHGVDAAMHSVSVMNVIKKKALPEIDFLDPAQVLKALNTMFQMDAHDDLYFTLWYGVYDFDRRTLSFASGGHPPGILVSPDKREAMPLLTPNIVIGAIPQSEFIAKTQYIQRGSSLYLFSDGVFEIITHEGNMWDMKDYIALILEPTIPGISEPLRLYQSIQRIAKRVTLDDDFSLLVVSFM